MTALEIITDIESDYDKVQVLNTLFEKRFNYSDEEFLKLTETVNSIENDYEKANVVKSIAVGKIVTENQWLSLILLVDQIESQYEKEMTLEVILNKMPNSEKIKTSFLGATKKLSNDGVYGKMLRTIEN